MLQDIANNISNFFNMLLILCIIFVPLGLWKLIEIIIWIINHIHIVIK